MKKENYKLSLKINSLPKSLNKKLQWGARFANVSENKSWDKMIGLECMHRLPKTPLPKAKISIVRHSYRTLDFDGLVGSMKPVVDALVSCGVLIDDSWGVIGAWSVDQLFRPKKLGPLLEITIEEII